MKKEDKENIDLEDLSGGDFWKCGCGKYHHITDVVCPKIKKRKRSKAIKEKRHDRDSNKNEDKAIP